MSYKARVSIHWRVISFFRRGVFFVTACGTDDGVAWVRGYRNGKLRIGKDTP